MHLDVPQFFNDQLLKKDAISYRHYQNNIVNRCRNKNSLIVLPTGLGKTVIAILLIMNALKKYSEAKIIILAPTRPLVSQHGSSCVKFLNIKEEKISVLTGKIPPERRIFQFKESRIVISTPQVIKNDLMRGRYDLKSVSLIIFDEAHRTTGNYAYNFISTEYMNTCTDPLILGLTASPGKDYDRIQELCNNLFIENVAFRTYDDPDVKDYIHDVDTFLERIELPISLLELSEIWDHLFKRFLKFFIDKELINPKRYYSKLDFLRISSDLTLSLRYEKEFETEIEDDWYIEQLNFQDPKIIDIVREKKINIRSVYSYCSSCISILHAKDLLETQDISLFQTFMNKIEFKAENEILAAKRIVKSKHYDYIRSVIEKQGAHSLAHPKIDKLIEIVREEINTFQNEKIIIFTQYREMAELLKNILQKEFSNELKVEKFIGQASKRDDHGLSQYRQIELLQKFRDDEVNVLIATSVAEEGLDIPNVDAIIFYEPVPSEIRFIQRRGRTGRSSPGRCYILVTEDTVDVPYYIVARRKEDTMKNVLLEPEQLDLNKNIVRKQIKFQPADQSSQYEVIKNFKERRKREKELLAERSIEEILTELDKFSRSKEYKRIKNHGVTFFSDIVKMEKEKLKPKLLKIKGKKSTMLKEKKRYLNRNVKTLINIAKTYCEDGKMSFEEFQELAEDEDIIEKKFYMHFYHACNLGHISRKNNTVFYIKDYD